MTWFLVCEDGDEYVRRFQRFFGAALRFVRAGSLAEVQSLLAGAPSPPAALLLDLDFRRTPTSALVDDGGLPPRDRVPFAADQGIFILRALRAGGCALPALLFADIDDRERATYLESTLAPLRILSGRVGLPEVGAHLRRLAGVQGQT